MGKVWRYDVDTRTKTAVLDLSHRFAYEDAGAWRAFDNDATPPSPRPSGSRATSRRCGRCCRWAGQGKLECDCRNRRQVSGPCGGRAGLHNPACRACGSLLTIGLFPPAAHAADSEPRKACSSRTCSGTAAGRAFNPDDALA